MPLPITLKDDFADAAVSNELSDLDNNFSTIATTLDGINDGSQSLSNVSATTVNSDYLVLSGDGTGAATPSLRLNNDAYQWAGIYKDPTFGVSRVNFVINNSEVFNISISSGSKYTASFLKGIVVDSSGSSIRISDGGGTLLRNTGVGANIFENIVTYSGGGGNVATGNTFFGNAAGRTLTTGDYNVAVGTFALDAIQTGSDNVAIGYDAGTALVTGEKNVFVGAQAGLKATGRSNTYIGYEAGQDTIFTDENVAIGRQALEKNKAGSFNVAVGTYANRYCWDTTTGWSGYNTSIGYQSMQGSTTAANNTGKDNTAVGAFSLSQYTHWQFGSGVSRHCK